MINLNSLFLFFYCALIFWLSHQPVLAMPIGIPHIDKLIHAVAYFIMGLLAWRAFSPFSQRQLITLVFCSLYGLLDEWHQSFIVGRMADVFDWLADTIGAYLSVLFMTKISSLQKLLENR